VITYLPLVGWTIPFGLLCAHCAHCGSLPARCVTLTPATQRTRFWTLPRTTALTAPLLHLPDVVRGICCSVPCSICCDFTGSSQTHTFIYITLHISSYTLHITHSIVVHSLLVVCLHLTLVVGLTFALPTSPSPVTTHICGALLLPRFPYGLRLPFCTAAAIPIHDVLRYIYLFTFGPLFGLLLVVSLYFILHLSSTPCLPHTPWFYYYIYSPFTILHCYVYILFVNTLRRLVWMGLHHTHRFTLHTYTFVVHLLHFLYMVCIYVTHYIPFLHSCYTSLLSY